PLMGSPFDPRAALPHTTTMTAVRAMTRRVLVRRTRTSSLPFRYRDLPDIGNSFGNRRSNSGALPQDRIRGGCVTRGVVHQGYTVGREAWVAHGSHRAEEDRARRRHVQD